MAIRNQLQALTVRMWPEAGRTPETEKQALMIMAITLVNLPLVTAAVVWQVAATDWGIWQQQWPLFAILLVASILLGRQQYRILVNWLAHYLSQATMRSQLRADGLALLEQLGQAIIKGPADASNLQAILADYVPQLFAGRPWEIRLFAPAADESVPAWSPFSLHHGEDNGVALPTDWQQLRRTTAA
jgi:hypothetical protein